MSPHALPQPRAPAITSPLVGGDPALRAVVARAQRVAPTRIPVLINGESGTGKELLAQLIHRVGPSPSGALVAVNCGTLPRELADSELFGHERGAFTGAANRKAGWFEEASGGTLVLDEVGELPLDLQPKLLRVLETGRLRRVGGCGEIVVNVRIVAMTLRDLRQETSRGRFRLDLYHRLAGFELTIPPLRRRKGDIPLLVEHVLGDPVVGLGAESGLGGRTVDAAALQRLVEYEWPGNVRELRNVLRRAAVLCPHIICAEALELPTGGYPLCEVAVDGAYRYLADADGSAPTPSEETATASLLKRARPQGIPPRRAGDAGGSYGNGQESNSGLLALGGRTFDQIERAVFGWALDQNGGSRRRAARALGLPRSSFCDKVRRHGLP